MKDLMESHPWQTPVKFGIFVLIWILTATGIQAATKNPDSAKSVVGIEAKIPKIARTSQFLGTHRTGSGVVIDQNGLIVTIGYLILEAETVTIIDIDNQHIPASIIGYDADSGFGLLRALIELKAVPITLGESAKLSKKDTVTVVSHMTTTAHAAHVDSRRTFTGYWEYLLENAIFTVPAMPHFSGAALIDESGTLVGIGSLLISEFAEINGVSVPSNMFVPVDQLKQIMNDLLKYGRSSKTPRPWLGVNATSQNGQVLVLRVTPNGPADLAGIKRGDIILNVGLQKVDSLETLFKSIWRLGNAGVEVPLKIMRGNSQRQVNIISKDRYRHYRMSHVF